MADLRELFELADGGIYVTEVLGAHSGVDLASGSFSLGAAGHRIRGGESCEPLKEMTLAGNLLQLLSGVTAVGIDVQVPRSLPIACPSFAVAEIAVSSRR
jgi:PmbA protein